MILLVAPPGKTIERRANMYSKQKMFTCVKVFKYLGHTKTEDINDDNGVERKQISLEGIYLYVN